MTRISAAITNDQSIYAALELSKNSWLLAIQVPGRDNPSLHPSRITHVPRCCPTSRAKSKLTAVLAGWVPIKESSGSFGKRAARGLRLIILPDFSCQL